MAESMSTSEPSNGSQRIVVKWGKDTIPLVLDLRVVGVAGLKQEVWEKTGVPVARQKLMCKVPKNLWKGVLKDEIDLAVIGTNKASEIQMLLMGSAPDQELKGPSVKTVFVEDLKGEEKAMVAAEPSGLVNLGNTCVCEPFPNFSNHSLHSRRMAIETMLWPALSLQWPWQTRISN
jgi:hypothetical protein